MEQTLNPNMTLQQAFEAGKRLIRPFQFTPQEPEGELITVKVACDIGSINHGGRQYAVKDGQLTAPVSAIRWWLSCGIPDGQDARRSAGRYLLNRSEGEGLATLSFKRGERPPNPDDQQKAQVSAVERQNQLLERSLARDDSQQAALLGRIAALEAKLAGKAERTNT